MKSGLNIEIKMSALLSLSSQMFVLKCGYLMRRRKEGKLRVVLSIQWIFI